MKDILSKKHRLGEFETVALTEGCTSMLMNKVPSKLKDPGSFSIPCSIGNYHVGKVLCDLGVSINLMPMSIFKKLGIGKARPTTVTLQLAHRSYSHPEGKIEDVLVMVDKFIFPVDFLILECKVDHDVPIILERPFLTTGRTLIDVQKALKCMDENEECHNIGLIEAAVDEVAKFCYNNSNSEDDLMEQGNTVSFEELGEFIEAQQIMDRPRKKFESLDLTEQSFKPPKPSIKESPTLELKPLLQHLKYPYLGNNNTLPIVISTKLTLEQEDMLL
ncbi:uncharacterized protein [Gossypium hirsutum]|uniref:Uncharacterized protein n=1 Tax=Gossypium hirsutum TaxID=3635 RepID=A0A1U8J723_GOSHI|nr:uncharacterized protein LOC107902295 [Gossypium hirsutum]